METEQRNNIRKNHVTLLDELNPCDIMDDLCQDGILSESDCEYIKSGKSRKDKCRLLLTLLPTRGPSAYRSFLDSLTTDYDHLVCLLRNSKQDMDIDTIANEEKVGRHYVNLANYTCGKCKAFIPPFVIPDFGVFIKTNCCLIFTNVEPNDLLDLLYQEFVFGSDECERIRSGNTRSERRALFISELAKCSVSQVKSIFMRSLERKYGFIAKELKQGAHVITENLQNKITDDNPGPLLTEPLTMDNRSQTEELLKKDDCFYYTDLSAESIPQTSMVLKGRLLKQERRLFHKKSNYDRVFTRCKDNFTKNVLPYPCYKASQAKPKRINDFQRHSYQTKFKTCAIDISQVTPTAVQVFSPRSILPREGTSKQFGALFNYLVPVINQGCYQIVKEHIKSFRRKSSEYPDIMCLLDYLHASSNLFTVDVDLAEEQIKTGLKRATETSNPSYFTLELLTAQSRMYFIQRKLCKLKNTVDDAKMIVEMDPMRYFSTAGYVFMNYAKLKSAQLEMLSVNRTNYHSVYEHLHGEAVSSCRRALEIFHRDEGMDGRFGLEFSMCRLAILMLRCGDNGLTMDVQRPCTEDIESAGEFLQNIENSDLPMPKILEVPYLLAKSDLQYRKANSVKALEHAEEADRLAQEMLLEFSVPARNRVVFLKKMPVFVNAVDTEEASRLLFCDLLDSW
ncbi:uncharacterized protein [Argopecten irradians]|uniref:uncharacterized protein n=1 Tax=Argopecten irradians TaxID=31199 RepID=UPI0037243DC8